MPDIFQAIDSVDKAILGYVHNHLQTPWAHAFFSFITNSRNWAVPLIVIGILLFFRGGKIGRVFAIVIIPVFFFSDFCTAKVFKPLIGRLRPFGHNGYAMPSAHAANSFAIAAIAWYFSKKFKHRYLFFVIAGMVAISRVYIGVHFPSDVIVGAVWGLCSALIIIALYTSVKEHLEAKWPRAFDNLSEAEKSELEKQEVSDT